jgi:tetratricopeptide (TPR) repeat protein
MKTHFLYSFILLVFCSLYSNAQIDISAEDKDLAFQNYFFEALKQKAIQNYSKAVENLEKCYEIDSTNMAVEFELSKNFLLMKKYFEAEQFINKALQRDPKNEFLIQHKGLVFKDMGSLEQAIEIYKNLVDSNSKYSQYLVELYVQGKFYDQAELLIEEMEEKAITTRRTKAYKLFIQNRKITNQAEEKPAVSSANKAMTIEELRVEFNKGKDFNILKQLLQREATSDLFELMEADSKLGIDYFPAQPWLYLMRAKALNALGKYNEAIDVLSIGIDFVIEDTNTEIEFYEKLSDNYNRIEDKANAEKYRLKAEQLRQKDK